MIIFTLPGSDKDECKIFSFVAIIPVDSLLLVDENDIRELSSSINKSDEIKF
jgi:hypothetical protein